MAGKKNENIIGALWNKSSSRCDFMSGKIRVNGEEIDIVCFENNYKKNERHPDWNVLLGNKKEKSESSGKREPRQNRKPQREDQSNYSDDDVPF